MTKKLQKIGKNRKGFTLMEFIVYLAIVSMFAVVLLQMSWSIFGAEGRARSRTELSQNGSLVMSRITQQIRDAENVRSGVGYEVDDTADDFNAGTHHYTDWDEGYFRLRLTPDGQTSGAGDFISRVMDAGTALAWGPLALLPRAPYGKELPNGAAAETDYAVSNVDMTGNTLLMHFNESSGTLTDASGQSNHGTNHGVAYNAPGRYRTALRFPGATSGSGQTTFVPIADTYLQQSAESNYGNSIVLKVYPRTNFHNRSLVKFDLSTLPPGATITSARLRLREAQTFGAPRLLSVHRMTHDWIEGTGASKSGATWTKYDGNRNWDRPGGDFFSAATSTILVLWIPWLFPMTDEWDVTSDVQGFVNQTFPNHGWMVKDAFEDNSQWYWFFQSRENVTKPQLVVTYTTPGAYVDAGNAASLMPARLTVEAWINPDTLPGVNQPYGVIGKGDDVTQDGYELYVRSSNVANEPHKIAWALGSTTLYSLQPPATGRWTHVIGTFDGVTMKLYVNGVFNSMTSATLVPNNRSLLIGVRTSSSLHAFDGLMDEVAVYNRALSDAEILNRYQRGALDLRFQVRSGATLPLSGDFIGPMGTSTDYYSEALNNALTPPTYSLTHLSSQRYFQYRAFLITEDPAFTPELTQVALGSRGSSFDADPGLLLLDFSGEETDVVIDTYVHDLVLDGRPVTVRTLRMKEGVASAVDLTSDRVTVTSFVVSDRTRTTEPRNVRVRLTLTSLQNELQSFLPLETSVSVRQQ